MNKLLAAIAILVAACAAAAGLFARPANSQANPASCSSVDVLEPPSCQVDLTAAGPVPSTLTIHAGQVVEFSNQDSVTHTVVFANGLCSLTLTPGAGGHYGGGGGFCDNRFTFYPGRYRYMVDGNFPGTVVTVPVRRSVTLTARTHTIRGGTRLTLHGRVDPPGWRYHVSNPPGWRTNVSVIVLARHNGKHPYRRIATVNPGLMAKDPGNWRQDWTLTVQPGETTTYIAKVTAQLPSGQIFWSNAKSRPFTLRIRH
jgi:plastocyanin